MSLSCTVYEIWRGIGQKPLILTYPNYLPLVGGDPIRIVSRSLVSEN